MPSAPLAARIRLQMLDTELDGLLRQAQQGDSIAFAAIVKSRQAMVFSIARNFFRYNGLAEDIAQDVFLEMHRNLAGIESATHLTAWLRQVTGRKCIDQSRRVWFRRWVGLDVESDLTPAPKAKENDPFASDRIRKALGKLPDRTRMMIVMRYQEEMEPAEIAEALSVPVGTVKSSIHRGLDQMRKRMAHREIGVRAWIGLKLL